MGKRFYVAIEKQSMLGDIASSVAISLGYIPASTKLVYTDETGASNEAIKGHYSSQTNTSYINDKNNNSTIDLLFNSVGIQTGISKQIDVLQNNGTAWIIYMHSQGNLIAKEGANTNTNTYRSYGSPLPSSVVKEIFNTEANKNDGDYVANPQNIIIPTTWFEPGHGTENYGAAKEAKEKNLNKKEK